jgi:cytosine/adenosine deaminase-related metal-dependent hydrolase
MPNTTVAYRAKWVFPVERSPIENGTVICDNGLIKQVGSGIETGSTPVIDLGEVAIIPGLINAHTHLEFSDLTQPLGDPQEGFTKWIGSVVSHRRNNPATSITDSIQQGIEESIAAGVVALGEISTTPWDHTEYSANICGVVFHEQLGNNPLDSIKKTAEIESKVRATSRENWQPGVSPHAPYSTSLNLFQSLVELAEKTRKPVAMHLAETLEEVEFVETGKGAFANLLESLGVPFNRSGPLNISDYLNRLSKVHSLIIHGNFLSSDELELIAGFKNQHVVFCPRTHKFFGHPEYPLRTMLDLGISVAVGTDSRASNPDLNLFEEFKTISATQPQVSPEEILKMGTLNGALALQLEHKLGSISPGKQSSLCAVENLDCNNPMDSLFADGSVCKPILHNDLDSGLA